MDDDRRPLTRILAAVAAAGIAGFELRRALVDHAPVWAVALAVAAALAWLAAGLAPSRRDRLRVVLLLVGVATGSLAATATQVVGFIPAIVGVAVLLSRPRRPLVLGAGAAVGALALVGVGALLDPELVSLVSALVGLVIAVLLALSRRQYRAAEAERAALAALAERSRIARDIHDVLAHSLGGLVLQLDAVEALLEAGRGPEALARVTAARGLAAEGLEEARRAVDALRDPEAATDPAAAIRRLVETHRSLGARAELHETGEPAPLDPAVAGALRRAAQEVLSNARRHAPGMPTELTLDWSPGGVGLRASTALAAGASASSAGGGRGLAGMRERMTALGGTATAGVQGRDFVVEARIPVRAAR